MQTALTVSVPKHELFRMRFVEGFGRRVGVVIADDVANREAAGAASGCLAVDHAVKGGGARSVVARGDLLHGDDNVGALGIGRRRLFVVQATT